MWAVYRNKSYAVSQFIFNHKNQLVKLKINSEIYFNGQNLKAFITGDNKFEFNNNNVRDTTCVSAFLAINRVTYKNTVNTRGLREVAPAHFSEDMLCSIQFKKQRMKLEPSKVSK